MPEYRAYILGIDGHRFIRAADFLSDHPNDAAAMKAAEQLVHGHDVELWDGGRLVAKFDHSQATAVGDEQPKAVLRKLVELA
jgi:hypothetical protein